MAAWEQAALAATLCWMSCWTWPSVKAWWISTTVSKPSALDASTWSRQRSGQLHRQENHFIFKLNHISEICLAHIEEVTLLVTICSPLSTGYLQESQVFKHLFFPPVVWKFKEWTECIISPLWDLCKGHCNSFREKTHCFSVCYVGTCYSLDVKMICIFNPYYVNLTLTWLFITFVVICRGALIKCTPHVFVDFEIFILPQLWYTNIIAHV